MAAHRFAPAVRRCPDAELVAFCSRSIDRAREYAARFDAPAAYDDLAAFLRDERIRAVYIATPNALHAEHTQACLAAGQHVLCDKPLALSATQARAMLKIAQRIDRTLGVLHQQRFHPAHEALRERLAQQRLGRLSLIRAELGYLAAPDGKWRQQPALSGGGPGMDLSPHALDILLQTAGSVRAVTAMTANVLQPFEVEDYFHAVLEHADGVVSHVEAAFCAHSYGGRLEVRGDAGSFIAEGSLMASDTFRWQLHAGTDKAPIESGQGEFRECFDRAIADFGRAVESRQPPTVTADDGIAVMAVLDAAYESARTGRTIALLP